MEKINCSIINILDKNKLRIEFYINNIKKESIFIINDNNISIYKLKKLFFENKHKNNYVIIKEIKNNILYGNLYINNINITNYDNYKFEKINRNIKNNSLGQYTSHMNTIIE